ncbi:hypothetical protein CVU37_01695 [candidate division BRC1 bacterium HGW-BRC1-1]|jgi:alkaline phosphatase|nr:MAG: hypothetical protein CVU37_01695 [candidate division BRC1 bacterium HGW-BRC1-1]
MKVIKSVSLLAVGFAAAAFCSTAQAQNKQAKNVILFIGDGMGHAQVEAAVFQKYGTKRDDQGNPPKLSFEKFPFLGYTTNFSSDSFVTDSSAAGTALASGQKTNNGVLGVTPDGRKPDTIADIAKAQGQAVGILSSVGFNHATPGAFFAHSDSRNDYDEITSQVFTADNPADVLIGGGIYSKTWTDDLLEAEAAKNDIKIFTIDNLNDLTPDKVGKSRVLGYFDETNNKQLDYITSRTAASREPRLVELTTRTLDLLMARADDKGFFLMVEGGSIDWACHANMAGPAIGEVLEFDAAIAATLEVLKQRNELENTMIVVTADHETGGLTLVGPYKKTLEQAPVQYNFSSTNHTGIPVMVWAQGPGAQTLNGKNDQTHVFEAMKAAITPQAGMGR